MQRFFIALCALMLTTSIGADIKYDNSYYTFYSLPKAPDIDQEQYHQLFMQIIDQIIQLKKNSSNTNEKIEKEIVSYLKALNSPLSLRLLQDITKNGFYSNLLCLSTWALYQVNSTDAFDEELSEYILIKDQVVLMIITCWNNGAYGKTVHDQIVSYLKSVGTPEASDIKQYLIFS